MGKGIYIGVGGKARKVKKMYVGVGSRARKVKKAYIGVGGVARPCFSGGELVYYGTATPLSISGYMSAAAVGNYALFCNYQNNVVESYDNNLSKNTAASITYSHDNEEPDLSLIHI